MDDLTPPAQNGLPLFAAPVEPPDAPPLPAPPVAPAAMPPAPAPMPPAPAAPAPGALPPLAFPLPNAAPGGFAPPTGPASPGFAPPSAPAPAPHAGSWGAPAGPASFAPPGTGLPAPPSAPAGSPFPAPVMPVVPRPGQTVAEASAQALAAQYAQPMTAPMTRYDPNATVERVVGISARTAWATALLGMQAAIPLLGGLVTVIGGAALNSLSSSDLDGLDINSGGLGASGIGGVAVFIGVLASVYGLAFLWCATCVARRTTSAGLFTAIVEFGALAILAYFAVVSDSFGSSFVMALAPIATLLLVFTDR